MTEIFLADGDKILLEIAEGFVRFWHHFGSLGREEKFAGYTFDAFTAELQETLGELEWQGLVIQRGEAYSLTAQGRRQAKGMRKGPVRRGDADPASSAHRHRSQ